MAGWLVAYGVRVGVAAVNMVRDHLRSVIIEQSRHVAMSYGDHLGIGCLRTRLRVGWRNHVGISVMSDVVAAAVAAASAISLAAMIYRHVWRRRYGR